MDRSKPPFGYRESKQCDFVIGTLNRQCRHTKLDHFSYCEFHLDMRCRCGNQATQDCGVDFCTVLVCPECIDTHREGYHPHNHVQEY